MPIAGSILRRVILALAAPILSAAFVGAVAPNATEPTKPSFESLAGQLLIASPDMRDPRFDHAVILVVRHDAEGALGIVINNPAGERPLSELLAAIGESKPELTDKVPIFIGGPVDPDAGLVLHSAEYHCDGTVNIDGRVA